MPLPDKQNKPQRRRPARMPLFESGNQSIIIWLTLCSHKRKTLFADKQAHDCLVEVWSQATYWLVGRYLLMPDHIHLFCAPATFPPTPVRDWCKYWKSLASRRWPRQEERPLWQVDIWDRQLRRGESYREKWEYVSANPLEKKLVKKIEDWPYQGEMHKLAWHDC